MFQSIFRVNIVNFLFSENVFIFAFILEGYFHWVQNFSLTQFTFFQHCPLACIVSDEKSVNIWITDPLLCNVLFLQLFSNISLFFSFQQLTLTSLGVIFFIVIFLDFVELLESINLWQLFLPINFKPHCPTCLYVRQLTLCQTMCYCPTSP